MLVDEGEAANILENKRAKRRHARPLELHSDDEREGEPTAGNEGTSEKSEAVVADIMVITFPILLHLNLYLYNPCTSFTYMF